MELFQEIKTIDDSANAPLAYRIMPEKWEDFFGQQDILGPGKLLRNLIDKDRLSSVILFGPPGCGKSTLINIILKKTRAKAYKLNAVTAGVADIRKVISSAKEHLKINGAKTIVVIDEIHHFTRTQQDALLPDVESGNIILLGLTTENPHFFVNGALISRANMFEFKTLGIIEMKDVIKRALSHPRGLAGLNVKISDEAFCFLAERSEGDARKALNALEISALSVLDKNPNGFRIELEDVKEALSKKHVLYDKSGDKHYDIISAFIKSLRGSDPDAAVYYLALMLEGGENPLFIARRIVISASEDVGNADPYALILANAAFEAVQKVGLPEARIILSQAVTYIAAAHKSNAAYLAVEKAIQKVRNSPIKDVPNHLKDANLDGETRGHGKGYKYPHDFEGHFIEQEYLKDFDPQTDVFYKPTEIGSEKKLKERLVKLWGGRKKYDQK